MTAADLRPGRAGRLAAALRSLGSTPLEAALASAWQGIAPAARAAFAVACAVSLLAFGFEMTNLTLHHDDVNQLFIEDTILGHYLGRFGTGWLHYYTQGAHVMPFLQMAQGIAVMALYGVLAGRLWGATGTTDLALVACIACVFPYMGQVWQYNTTMATYSVAHLATAGAVVLSTRGRAGPVAAGALLYLAAFSIYQGVAANAATLLLTWVALRLALPPAGDDPSPLRARGLAGALVALAAGGALYFAAVSTMSIEFDGYQSAEQALRPGAGIDLAAALPRIAAATHAFYLWPEPYFPGPLKALQLAFLAVALAACLLLPRRAAARAAAFGCLVLACLAPRSLQLLHAHGHFHELTLTAYALVVGAAVLLARRTGPVAWRNAAALGAALLVAGYVVQCAWISTVGQLNTTAHYAMTTQVLSRLRALPPGPWDGRRIVVVGEYDMRQDYPFRRATGVAPEFMRARHMNLMARLLRDEAEFVPATPQMEAVQRFAQEHPRWPHPDSVGVVDGVGVVVLSRPAP
jgi:hypothetical protein